MSIQIVKIVKTGRREVAYLLDDANGVLFKVPVEDYTGGNARDEAPEEDIERPIYRPRRPMRAKAIVPEEIVDAEAAPPDEPPAPRKRPPSIMPPEMRGIFLPQDHPQAAKEVRRV